MDPRVEVIERRLAEIKRVIAISSGKGGVGKSCVASLMALLLAKSGRRVGLLDLDFYGPSTHVILGIRGAHPREERGIIPPEIDGIKFMSIIYYAGDRPVALRGREVSDAMVELLVITRWGPLDLLIIDMPPGLGDTTLDAIRLLKRAEFLVVTTPSRVALETVRKLLQLLSELKAPVLGVIENMKASSGSSVREELEAFSVPHLGEIAFDTELEEALGDREQLLKTVFARDLEMILTNLAEL